MKICFIEPGLHVCGGIRRILEVSNRLCKRGHQVFIYTPDGATPTWLPCLSTVRKLSKLNKTSFDTVVFNLADQYPIAIDAKATNKVFWVLAPEAEYKDPKVPIKALESDFYMVCNSTYTQKYIKRFRRDLPYNPPIIWGGINRDHFRYDVNIPTEYHVLYYGSWRPWKGTSIIENALKHAPIKRLKMEGLNTPQNKMYTLYNRCELYLSANQSEGFSFGQLEAMASGCPVITTDDGGSNDYIVPNYNAVVVPRDATVIKDTVLRVLDNKPLRRKLRRNGLRTASENRFDWDRVTVQFEASITSVHSGCVHKQP